jgi:hypothetical protein
MGRRWIVVAPSPRLLVVVQGRNLDRGEAGNGTQPTKFADRRVIAPSPVTATLRISRSLSARIEGFIAQVLQRRQNHAS